MRTRFTARVLAAIILGIVFWAGVALEDAADRGKGKQAFLVRQAERFDKVITRGHMRVSSCISAVAFVGAGVAAYELVGLAIYSVIRPRGKSGAA
jgi:hypothetical protein